MMPLSSLSESLGRPAIFHAHIFTGTRALWGGPIGEKKKNSPLDYHLIYTNQGMQTIRD
jgi:hypothetical protein